MGTFIGHFANGIFFVLIGIRWMFCAFTSYFRIESSKRKGTFDGNQFKSSTTFPFCKTSSNPDAIEAILKIIIVIFGIIGEIFSTIDEGSDGYFFNFGVNNAQHIVMNLFFGINGFIEVLQIKKVKFLPPGLDYFSMSLAFFVESVVFHYHTFGRPSLDIHVHQLLALSIFTCFVATLIEWKYRNHLLPVLFRTCCTIHQGSWCIQVCKSCHATIPYDNEDHFSFHPRSDS